MFMMKKGSNLSKFGTQPYRDVCNFRIDSLLARETQLKLDQPETWLNFYQKIEQLKNQTVEFIKREKVQGKKIWAYGASTKGNTLLQYFDIDHNLIDAIAERNPQKFNLKTVGTGIPIKSEAEMRDANPDYLLILPWHFISEFIDREQNYLKSGGKFIVPCPKFEIISWENI
jgi:hypothetical protein